MTHMNLPMKQNQKHREQISAGQGEGVGGGMDWEIRVRCKFLCLEWINNKVLLYSIENYIQYPMINHNGKEYFKKECVCVYIYIYIYIYMPLCSTSEINISVFINYTYI